MNIPEPENSGCILRPRQWVPLPAFMLQAHDWLIDNDGGRRWVGSWVHPELADLARRLDALFSTGRLTAADGENVSRVERVLSIARDYFGWWFEKLDVEALLPDAPDRPDAEAIEGVMPTWASFILVLGALHRCGAWLERVERKYGINRPTAASVVDTAYGEAA